jgi:hypothetical protein
MAALAQQPAITVYGMVHCDMCAARGELLPAVLTVQQGLLGCLTSAMQAAQKELLERLQRYVSL